MNGYFLSVFAVCAVLGAFGMITYRENSSVERAALAIIILYTVSAPIAEAVLWDEGGLSIDISLDEQKMLDEGYIDVAREAFELGICRAVAEKFSINVDNVSARAIDFDFKEMKAGKIKVLLTGLGALCDRHGVEKYLNGFGIGECEVNIEI
jgi:hypothetical protein